MKKRKFKEYPGVLNKPINQVELVLGALAATKGKAIEDQEQGIRDALAADLKLKFDLLFDHYGIPKPVDKNWATSWPALARKLALEHVRAFMMDEPGKRRGNPGRWKNSDFDMLIRAGKEVRSRSPNLSPTEALRRAASNLNLGTFANVRRRLNEHLSKTGQSIRSVMGE